MNIDRTVHSIPMSEIFSDDEFNCRGKIQPLDVVDLANDITSKGLDYPITIQPFKEHPPQKYRIVAGHRRFMAFRVNKAETIPCTIRTDLDDFKAAALNIRENVLRKDLNIKQEAHGIRKFMQAGWSEGAVAKELQQSRGWVQVRYMLLALPEDIQTEAAAGWMTQDQIRRIYSQKNPDSQYTLLRKIKEAKVRGEKVELPREVSPNHLVKRKRAQDRTVMFGFMDHVLVTIGAGFYTRILAWCAGEISDYEIHQDLEKYCEENDIPYTFPDEIRDAFKDKGSNA